MHADISISHADEGTFGSRGSPFVEHKARPDDESSAEEDDLDEINMDIYQDLVDAGKEFVDLYEGVRDKRKKQQRSKRGELLKLL